MGFRINTNTAALNSHQAATTNNRNLDNSLSKLSSGLRINKAADDASGLAIANSLRAQASALGQAVSNGNDAIGLIQTADGALSEYSNILDTIKTKATQAASDGQNTTSRQAIQKDINRLLENLNTIAKTTSFNGQKLLSGTFVNKEFQMGASANESIKTSIASAETSQIGQTTHAELNVAQMGENQLTLKSAVTGKELTLASVNIQANNNPANGMGALADQINKYSGETGITAKAVVTTTTASSIAAGTTGADFAINGVNIGSINVSANDTDGTLLTAINNKTTSTGVSATKTEDGKITLTSNDGRAISVSGDMSGVMGTTADAMSTIGHLEVAQVGSSTFQITGSKMGTAVGEDIVTTGTMTTIQDSMLEVGSVIVSDASIAAGSSLGFIVSGTVAMALAVSTKDDKLAVGSIIGSGSTLQYGTELGAKITTRATTTLTADMFIKAGSTLGVGTVFDAGTVLQQDFSVSGVTYKAGSTLTTDVTLATATTLTKDMTLTIDIQNQNAAIGASSTLLAGTILGEDLVTTSTATVSIAMTAKAGSTFLTGTNFAAGTILGDALVISSNVTTTEQTQLKLGSTIGSGSTLKENSTVGGELQLRAAVTLNQDMVIKAGSTLNTGTVLKAGTVINQDLTDAQVGGGTGSGLKAGTILGTDVTLTDQVSVLKDFSMIKGTSGTNASIAAGSKIAANGGGQNSVSMTNTEFTNLSGIDVTTLKGAMKAIDTVSAAITNLDGIRSDLGSVQNQIVSTINNVSVTQVNVKAAESNIRDVDFAQESANFSKFNILAQSGSYAMSQANAVQQNVLRLLQ
ncbi:flagellin, partial [Sulfurimonas sp.]|uniref:flagellin N-terminal helical domain-containing protein n=1 Tax=Sulfurimonas sp. TaxID=2022749 RepID=UPI0025FAAAFC